MGNVYTLKFSFYVVLSIFNCIKNINGQSQTSCDGPFKFKCGTNDCIPEEKRCDGVVDCIDGSDELNDCKELPCPGFLFTCDYGACIDMKKKCNGKKDCKDNSDEGNCITDAATKISSNCKSDQFECKSGQCIPADLMCDGTTDCTDKSDETKDACLNMPCPGFTFKCDYGACVDGYAKCNGRPDCADNSDEEDCGPKVTTVLPTSTVLTPTTVGPAPSSTVVTPDDDGCILPSHPDHGQWALWPAHLAVKKSPKEKVSANTIIQFTCNENYKLASPTNIIACNPNGTWSVTELPIICKKKCPALYTTTAVNIKCFSESQEIKCDEATGGDRAKFSCAPYYEQNFGTRGSRYCMDGSWNLPPPICQPVCGQKRVSATPLIVNGKVVQKGDYPWVAALYELENGQFGNICGGSIITQRVILSAAHCVTNEFGDIKPKENYMLAVGKYYKNYNDTRDSEAQYSQVQRIIIRTDFREAYRADQKKYANDIAILITKDVLLLSKVVQPICYQDLPNIFLSSGIKGVVAGWGFTQPGGSPSEELREVEVPFTPDSKCFQELPREWADQYVTIDKMCAGYYNKSIGVCRGDSGSALAFQNYRLDNRYYVHGIVSLSHTAMAGCDIQVSALYTRVEYHYEWLEKTIASYTMQ